MSKIKNGRLDQYGDGPSDSSNLEQLALKGLSKTLYDKIFISGLLYLLQMNHFRTYIVILVLI